MDPTKSLDNLDPKLKETYARVMGTTADPTQNVVPAPSDPMTSTMTPPVAPPPADMSPNTFGATPTLAPSDGMSTTPGTGGPAIGIAPEGTPSIFSSPTEAAPVPPAPDTANATASPFFSNPSPAASNGIDSSVPATPITPYTPMDAGQNAAPMSQPLPSPSSINQVGPHEVSPLLRVLYIVGAVVFFLIYTVFWIKVFNLPLPLPF
jgi:hypothetical protein